MVASHSVPSLMVIEDSNEDYFTLERSLRKGGLSVGFQWFNTVGRALAYIKGVNASAHAAPLPSAIVLDLGLPDGDGLAVLDAVRERPEWREIPVIVVSGSGDAAKVEQCHRHGASAYYVKGTNNAKLVEMMAQSGIHLRRSGAAG